MFIRLTIGTADQDQAANSWISNINPKTLIFNFAKDWCSRLSHNAAATLR